MNLSSLHLSKERAYIYSPFGLGDTAILCGLKNVIEQRYGVPVSLVIRKSHKIVMDIYGISDYILVDNYRYSPTDQELLKLAASTPYIQPGKLFIGHFACHNLKALIDINSMHRRYTMLDCYKAFFELDWDVALSYPKTLPAEITNNTNLNKILDEKSINLKATPSLLIIPEAYSFTNNVVDWKEIVERYRNGGYNVYTSVSNKNFCLNGVENISVNLTELIALCMQVTNIITIRSGICDLIWCRGNSLTAIYPDINTYYWGRIKSIFPESTVNEIVAV